MSVSKQADTAPTLRPPPVPDVTGMIVTANFSASGFSKRWSHCHQLANYLARFASANEGDSERYATLLSTFFNELLEAIYRNHEPKGQITINFRRNHGRLVVQAEVPVNEQSSNFYQHAAELVSQPDPMAWYRERLEEEVTALGLLELAVVYGSKLSIEKPTNGDSLSLYIEFPFNEVDEI
jgi:hypothetical protein